MNIPVNEANETTALIHELMEAASKEAKAMFVCQLYELVYERNGTREGKVLEVAAQDAEGTDLEWLQERLTDKVSTEIDRLRVFVEGLIEERDEARNEVERLHADVERLRWGNEMACENTPQPACQCPGCETARERADRGETGP